ncbi:hypothetical protein QJQ45_020438 [Haematococcus lacustris]|nr:hypothetical protein QJQ45_020438 [Haematococcus lacustris]
MVLFHGRGMAAAAKDVKRIERLHQDNPGLPTVFHIFSTGGYIKAAAIWQQMERLLQPDTRGGMLADIQGIIFDSAPAIVTEDVAVLALQSVFSGMSADALKRGDKGGPVQAALQTATRLAMRWYLARPHIITREQKIMDAWFHLAPRCPQLYLCSDADPVVAPSEVQRIMCIQASRGVAVFGWKWSTSGHCQHFKQHPEEYAHHVSHFLNNVALKSLVPGEYPGGPAVLSTVKRALPLHDS